MSDDLNRRNCTYTPTADLTEAIRPVMTRVVLADEQSQFSLEITEGVRVGEAEEFGWPIAILLKELRARDAEIEQLHSKLPEIDRINQTAQQSLGRVANQLESMHIRTDQDYAEWTAAVTQLAQVIDQMPATWYEDRPLPERVKLLVRQWNQLHQAYQQYEFLQAAMAALMSIKETDHGFATCRAWMIEHGMIPEAIDLGSPFDPWRLAGLFQVCVRKTWEKLEQVRLKVTETPVPPEFRQQYMKREFELVEEGQRLYQAKFETQKRLDEVRHALLRIVSGAASPEPPFIALPYEAMRAIARQALDSVNKVLYPGGAPEEPEQQKAAAPESPNEKPHQPPQQITPEIAPAGSRWLLTNRTGSQYVFEATVLEWAPSGQAVRVRCHKGPDSRWFRALPYICERLAPEKEQVERTELERRLFAAQIGLGEIWLAAHGAKEGTFSGDPWAFIAHAAERARSGSGEPFRPDSLPAYLNRLVAISNELSRYAYGKDQSGERFPAWAEVADAFGAIERALAQVRKREEGENNGSEDL